MPTTELTIFTAVSKPAAVARIEALLGCSNDIADWVYHEGYQDWPALAIDPDATEALAWTIFGLYRGYDLENGYRDPLLDCRVTITEDRLSLEAVDAIELELELELEGTDRS